jgi:hypothetical protein
MFAGLKDSTGIVVPCPAMPTIQPVFGAFPLRLKVPPPCSKVTRWIVVDKFSILIYFGLSKVVINSELTNFLKIIFNVLN